MNYILISLHPKKAFIHVRIGYYTITETSEIQNLLKMVVVGMCSFIQTTQRQAEAGNSEKQKW